MKEMIEGPRGCKKEEFKETMGLINFVFRTSKGKPPLLLEDYPYVYQNANLGNMRIVKEKGKVVSHLVLYPAQIIVKDILLKIGGIGGVVTHPEFRGKGYASLILKDCLRKMEEENYDLSILWTGIPDFYRKLGWELGGKEFSFWLNKGNLFLLPKLPQSFSLIERIKNWQAIKRLHEAEPFRLKRGLETYPLLFSIPKRRSFFLAKGKKIEAYLNLKEEEVLEYGGGPELVAALLRLLLEKKEFKHFNVFTPALNSGLPKLLQELGLPKKEGYLGMVRIIKTKSLLTKLGRESLDPNNPHIVKLLFGPERVEPGQRPINLYWWRSEHI